MLVYSLFVKDNKDNSNYSAIFSSSAIKGPILNPLEAG